MNTFLILFGLTGTVLCNFKVRSAWRGEAGVPIGTIIGGMLLGPIGAGLGSAAAGDDNKNSDEPNVGGMIFWCLVGLVWLGMMIAGFAGE